MKKRIITTGGMILLFVLGTIRPSHAADLEARQWSHLPMDSDFIGVGYAYTEADISFDPVLLIEDAEMELQTWGVKYPHLRTVR